MDSVEAATSIVKALIDNNRFSVDAFPGAQNMAEAAGEAFKVVLNATSNPLNL